MNQPEQRTAIGYIRVSSDEQVEGLSLASQEEKIRAWCEQRGYRLLDVVRDEGESAYTDDINKRPGFASLLQRLPHIRPDIVVVFSLDRWARSLPVASQSFRRMAELGIGFASVTEQQFDLSNPASSLMLNLISSFAEYSSAITAQHVRRVADMKFENGIHRGSVPFGYRADPASTRANPLPPVPYEPEFSAVRELFRRFLTGTETCRTLANWLNRNEFTTRNRKKTAREESSGDAAAARRFTVDSVRGIISNVFYTGAVVRQRRKKNGTASSAEVRKGSHEPAVSPEEFNRAQSVLQRHRKSPRSSTSRLRPYVGKGLIRCFRCGEPAWCQHVKGRGFYREASAQKGILCEHAGRYWPVIAVDDQLGRLVKPAAIPLEWQRRALEIAMSENNLVDVERERASAQGRRRRLIEVYLDGDIDRAEYERKLQVVDNILATAVPVEFALLELSIKDFEHFGELWDKATPEEKNDVLNCMLACYYVDFSTGQVVEIVPRAPFRAVLEAASIVRPVPSGTGLSELVIGDPDRIRTGDLHRDRVAC